MLRGLKIIMLRGSKMLEGLKFKIFRKKRNVKKHGNRLMEFFYVP